MAKKVVKKKKEEVLNKELLSGILIESFVFAIFISLGNSYLLLQMCGTKYCNFLEMFILQLPLYFALFICLLLVHVLYTNKRVKKK